MKLRNVVERIRILSIRLPVLFADMCAIHGVKKGRLVPSSIVFLRISALKEAMGRRIIAELKNGGRPANGRLERIVWPIATVAPRQVRVEFMKNDTVALL
ncbi:MAG: hypothetical protein NTV52_00170, partial [Acidobacteria bacterium]|nr:hypothetical protein [Acidobacteriota bacterium]